MSVKVTNPMEFALGIETLYKRGLPPGDSTGWPSVDALYTVKTGQWTAVTGVPGHGKSEWLDALLINLARLGWQHIIFSPENQPHELHLVKLMEKWVGKPFGSGPNPRMTHEEWTEGLCELATRFEFLTVDKEFVTVPSLVAVLNAAADAIDKLRKGGKGKKIGLVIDPWNEMDHARPSNLSETEYISQCLSTVRQFARDWDIHIWLVAHPTKLQKDKEGKYPVARLWDISGSAHWNNKADNGITIHRDVLNPMEPVQVHVQKVRFKNIGKPGLAGLNYERLTGRYHDPEGTTLTRKELAAGEEACPI